MEQQLKSYRIRYWSTATVFCVPFLIFLSIEDSNVNQTYPGDGVRILLALSVTLFSGIILDRIVSIRTQFRRVLTTWNLCIVVCLAGMIFDINLMNVTSEPFAVVILVGTWGLLLFFLIFIFSFTSQNFSRACENPDEIGTGT